MSKKDLNLDDRRQLILDMFKNKDKEGYQDPTPPVKMKVKFTEEEDNQAKKHKLKKKNQGKIRPRNRR